MSRGTYRDSVRERDRLVAESARLAQQIEKLEASNTSLSRERVQLIDQVENLRQTRAKLTDHVAGLEADRDQMASELDTRRREVAAGRGEIDSLRDTYDSLVSDLQSEVSQGRIEIEHLREGLRMNLAQDILFPLGSARLDPGGREILERVAARLSEIPHAVEVQGHTDALPIHGALAARYPSNWELAGARAAEVVRLFEARGVDASRLRAVSYGSTRPKAPNDRPEGRAANRRIEIRLSPIDSAESVPPPVEAPTGSAAEGPVTLPGPDLAPPAAGAP